MTTIALIGCSKSKQPIDRMAWVPARELYTGDLFKKRVAHVESRGLPWYILSAGGGVIAPNVLVRTYDKTLNGMSDFEIAEWHAGVLGNLLESLYYNHGQPSLKSVTFEIHAGKRYSQPLEQLLNVLGIKVVRPVKGLGIGEQLAYYNKVHA